MSAANLIKGPPKVNISLSPFPRVIMIHSFILLRFVAFTSVFRIQQFLTPLTTVPIRRRPSQGHKEQPTPEGKPKGAGHFVFGIG